MIALATGAANPCDHAPTPLRRRSEPPCLVSYCVRYHGSNRKRDVDFLLRQDIVVTTYGTLAKDASLDQSPLEQLEWYVNDPHRPVIV